jgi:hypothetical protein
MGRPLEPESPLEPVDDEREIERRIRRLWWSVMPLYRDPATAGSSSPETIANTPEKRAQVARGEAFAAERDRLEKAGLSPAELLAGLEDWLAEHDQPGGRAA